MQTSAFRAPGGTVLGIVGGLAAVPVVLALLDHPVVLGLVVLALLVAAVALPGWARTGLLAGVAAAALGTLVAVVLAFLVVLALLEGVLALLT